MEGNRRKGRAQLIEMRETDGLRKHPQTPPYGE